MRRPAVALLLTLIALALPTATAAAQDSMAPPGADPSWLPADQWVMLRWLPWDEERLYTLLRTDRGEVFRWVRIDAHNSLWRLARRKHWRGGLDALAARLVAPRARAVGPRMAKVLRRRARITLTQAHLGQHLLFHDLHQTAISDHAEQIFGVPDVQVFYDLRRAEVSPLQIGELFGRSRVELAQACVRVLTAANRLGVRKGAISREQAARVLDRQLSQIPRWLGQNRYNGPTAGGSKPDVPPGDYANRPSISAHGARVAWDAYRTDRFEAEREGEIHVAGMDMGHGHHHRAFGISPPEPEGSKRPTSAYNSVLAAGGTAAAFETAETSYPLAKRVGQMSVVHRDLATGRLTKVSKEGMPADVRTRTAYNPSISADGRLVAFEASDIGQDGRPAGTGVWLADVAARTQRLIVRESAGAAYLPVLSADGTKLAWSEPHGASTQIVVHDVATGGRQVLRAGGDVYEPSLSADGAIVALTTRARDLGGSGGGRSRVYVRRLSNGVTRLVSSGVEFAHQPSLSSDGARVAFVSRRRTRSASILGQRSKLLVADVESGARRTAFGRRGWTTQPALAQDGGSVVATTTAQVGRKPFGLAGVIRCDLRTGDGAPLLLSSHRRGTSARVVRGTGGDDHGH
jgi:hypothetical protein